MATGFHSKILCWLMFAITIVGLINSAGAATPERPKEINKAYDFKGKDMQGFGSEVNADISYLDQMFGTVSGVDVYSTPPEETEQKGWLGIYTKLPAQQPKQSSTNRVLQAIEVESVVPDSAAEAAGLHEGDLIAAIDGEPFTGIDDQTLIAFRSAIAEKHRGEKLKLRVLRGDTWLELDATIRPSPRVHTFLKPHPDLDRKLSANDNSLLDDVLKKEGLTGEYARLLKEFRNQADNIVSPLVRKDDYNPFRLQEVNYIMYNPMELPAVARKITDRLSGAYNKTHHDLAALVGTAMDELDMKYVPVEPKKKPDDFTGYVERLVNAIQHANSERAAVLSVLNADEIDFLYATAPKLLVGDKKSSEQDESEAGQRQDEARLLRFYRLVLKLDLSRLFNASAEIARALDLETLEALSKKSIQLQNFPRSWIVHQKENMTVIDTPAGRVLIGGTQDNIYTEDAALIIDLGGNDKYLNHAGGSTRLNPFSVVIDLSGNDVYSATDDFAQGAGLLGGGFLIDLAGDDRYMAKNFSQGTGVLGVGMLADLSGRDQYSAIAAAQGAGSFGIGILAEGGGDDTYFGNYFVQGAGDTKGFGAIVEAADNDNYFAGGLFEDFRAPGKSYQSMSQGFGFGVRPDESPVGASGGIGVIAEAEGNDTYVADYFAQGSSFWFSLGILDDRKGNDRYVSGRYSQGAGIHSSAGVLIDGEGDDNYLADFGVAQGCGHDFGIGFLLDNGGNDRYVSGTIAQGAGNANGIGVLSDNGGNDEYYLKSYGQGRGNFEPSRNLGSFGFLFDTGGGTDVYSQGGKNNSINYQTQWGILLDTN